jgi:16S rRNA (guanine966-N2)-methyltransferase
MKRETNEQKSQTGLRIIGGSLKRSKLEVLDREGLRPTPARVRETLFNWIMPAIPGAEVVDCFAGTGILGLEALSRGASRCTFLEKDPAVARQIEGNLRRFQRLHQSSILITDTFDVSTRLFNAADIIFADPPFHHGMTQEFLTWIRDKVQPDSRLAIECEKNEVLNLDGFEVIRELKAGIDWLRLLRPTS